MKAFLWAMVFAIIGGVLGGFLALGFGASVGVASGLIQGSQTGVCLAMATAREQDLLSAEQADGLILDTIARIKTKTKDLPAQAETVWVADVTSCAELIAKLEPGAPAAR